MKKSYIAKRIVFENKFIKDFLGKETTSNIFESFIFESKEDCERAAWKAWGHLKGLVFFDIIEVDDFFKNNCLISEILT